MKKKDNMNETIENGERIVKAITSVGMNKEEIRAKIIEQAGDTPLSEEEISKKVAEEMGRMAADATMAEIKKMLAERKE